MFLDLLDGILFRFYKETSLLGGPRQSLAVLGGPREVLGKSRGSPGEVAHESVQKWPCYKVQNRPQIRSSGFLGVNVGLEPVRNLSKSGFEPDEDGWDAEKL